MNVIRTKGLRFALPITLIVQLFFTNAHAQVSTGYFNGSVFSTFTTVGNGALSGNNFLIVYTGGYATRQLANYTPGNIPANTGYPGTGPRDLEIMANAVNSSIRYNFTTDLPLYSTFFIEDVDFNESVKIEFLTATGALVNISNIIYRPVSTVGQPAVTTTATAFTLTATATLYDEPLQSFIINTTNVRSVRITQLTASTGGTYVSFFSTPGLDHGDAPASYGDASHLPSTDLKLGTITPDAEASAAYSANANGDDAVSGSTIVDDEGGVSAFSTLYTNSTTYAVTVAVTNTTGANATLYGWIDFNRDGDFDAGEISAVRNVASGATSVTVNWTGLSGLTIGTNFARFRIASSATEAGSPTGLAANGEVEDFQLVNIILPLNLISFSGARTGDNIVTKWETENEVNVSHFELEYSIDGTHYSSGGSIPANNKDVNKYEFTLINYTQPLYYIRLKSVDIDGRTKYSAQIVIKKNGNYANALLVTPNPVTERAIIHVTTDVNTIGIVNIYDLMGHAIYQGKHQLVRGDNTIYLNSLSTVARGTYIVQAILDNERLVQKIIISR